MHLGSLVWSINQLPSHSKLITWPVGAGVWWSSLLSLLLKWLNYFHRFSTYIFPTLMLCIFFSAFQFGFCLLLGWFTHDLFCAGSSFFLLLCVHLYFQMREMTYWANLSQTGQRFPSQVSPQACQYAQWLPLSLVQIIHLLSPSLTLALLYFARYCPWGWKSANAFPNLPYQLVSYPIVGGMGGRKWRVSSGMKTKSSCV